MTPLARSSRVVLLLAALTLLVFTKDRPNSWADGSRLGTTQAIVEHGTLALDDTDFLWQGDKVLIGEHFYSHQPPMLAILGAAPYAVLHHVLGRGINDPWTYRVVTLCVVGLPVLAGLWALAHLLRRAGASPLQGAFWLGAAFFGTLLLPYSLVLNQHGPAAGLVLLGFLCVDLRRYPWAGAMLGLACTVDLTAVFPALACAWPVLRSGRVRGVLHYGLAAGPIVAFHLGLNVRIVGDLVPVGLHVEAFDYPLSPFLLMSLTGGNAEDPAGTLPVYVWRALFGQSGLFSHHPILLVCVAAGIALLFQRRPRELAPGILVAAAASAVGIAGYYLLQSRNFGGSSFGMRWFAVFAPLLVLFPAALFGGAVRPSRGWVAVVLPLTLWSVAAASLGAVEPWRKFAYLPAHDSGALLRPVGAKEPDWRDHLKSEWHLTRTWRQRFDKQNYEDLLQTLVIRLGKLHVKRFPGMGDAQYAAWVQQGIDKLTPFSDQADRAKGASGVKTVSHFFLGNFYRRLGRRAEAQLEYHRSLESDSGYMPAILKLREMQAE